VTGDNITQTDYYRFIVPDHLEDPGQIGMTRYLLSDYSIKGMPEKPVFALPIFKEFAPLFADDLPREFANKLRQAADPEHEGARPWGRGYWRDNRQEVTAEMQFFANYFDIELSPTFMKGALEAAQEFRAEKQREMATPEWQAAEAQRWEQLAEFTPPIFDDLGIEPF
jgi:hypothetical protein